MTFLNTHSSVHFPRKVPIFRACKNAKFALQHPIIFGVLASPWTTLKTEKSKFTFSWEMKSVSGHLNTRRDGSYGPGIHRGCKGEGGICFLVAVGQQTLTNIFFTWKEWKGERGRGGRGEIEKRRRFEWFILILPSFVVFFFSLSLSVCSSSVLLLRLSHAYANLDCWVALLLSYYFFLPSFFELWFFFFFFSLFLFVSAVRVPRVCVCQKFDRT